MPAATGFIKIVRPWQGVGAERRHMRSHAECGNENRRFGIGIRDLKVADRRLKPAATVSAEVQVAVTATESSGVFR
jgi:hypothetical protein